MTLKFGKLEKVTTDEGHLVCKAGAKKNEIFVRCYFALSAQIGQMQTMRLFCWQSKLPRILIGT